MNMKKIKYWLKTPASVRRHNQDEYRALEIKYDVLRSEYAHALKHISVELGYYENPESVCGCMKFLILEQVPGLKYTTTENAIKNAPTVINPYLFAVIYTTSKKRLHTCL